MPQAVPFSLDPATRTGHADPRDPVFFENPYAFYAEAHAASPAFFWKDYGYWCFAGFNEVNALLRDKRFGRQILHVATREELGWPEPKPHVAAFDLTEKYSLLALEPPAHTRLRTLVNRAFVSRHVEQLRPRIEALANEIVDGFEADGEVEIIKAFAAPIPAIVIAEMIGLPVEMAPQLLNWSNRMVQMFMFGTTEAQEHDANTASQDFMDYIRTVIAERRKSPREDLLTHMIVTEQGGERLNEEEIVSTAILLLNAGHEATVHQIGNSVRVILDNGCDPALLFKDEPTTERTVEETLRICAPVHIFQRWALEPVEIDGVSFKRGDKVSLILAAANLDPAKFTDPLTFKPDRNEAPNLSFGAGIHFCIGAPLARLELNVVLPILFKRLPGLKLAKTPVVKDVYHFHGLDRLDLVW